MQEKKQNYGKHEIYKYNTSSNTKKGAITKAWMRLSKRAGARFCEHNILGAYMRKGKSRIKLWQQKLTSNTPWPMNCPIQHTIWITRTTYRWNCSRINIKEEKVINVICWCFYSHETNIFSRWIWPQASLSDYIYRK